MGEGGRNEGGTTRGVAGKKRKKKEKFGEVLTQHEHSHSPILVALCLEQPSSMAALCPVRRRLLSALLRQPRRTFTSATDSSEKILQSQDDWTAFQLDRAERTTLG